MLFAFLLQLHPARDMTYLLECLSGEGAPHKKTSLQVMRKSAIQTHRKRRTVCFNATVQKDTRGTDYLMNPSPGCPFSLFVRHVSLQMSMRWCGLFSVTVTLVTAGSQLLYQSPQSLIEF